MPDVQEVADALTDTITAATGLRCFPFLPSDVNPPACVLLLGAADRTAFRLGSGALPFEAHVYVSTTSDRSAGKHLYEYVSWTGTRSMWNALEQKKDLGLSGCDAAVLRYRPVGLEEIAVYGYLGGIFDILVTTTAGA